MIEVIVPKAGDLFQKTINAISALKKIITSSGISNSIEVGTLVSLLSMPDIPKNMKIRTLGFYEEGDGGDGYYVTSDTDDGDEVVHHTLISGTVAKLQLSDSGCWYMEQFGCKLNFLGDTSARLFAALQHEVPIVSRAKRKTYVLEKPVFTRNVSIDLDINGCELLTNSATKERALLFIADLTNITTINGLEFSLGRTRFTVPLGHGIVSGDKIKAYSNQIINPFSAFDRQRVAEYFEVESVTDDVIVCAGKHIWSYDPADNPRLAKMSNLTCNLHNVKINRTTDHTDGNFAVAIDVSGYYRPQICNIHAKSFTGQLLSIRSCFRAKMKNISADFLLDEATKSALGYVGVDYGSQESEWFRLNGGVVRHTYTTGATSIDADTVEPRSYGGAVRCHVWTGVTVGCTNFAYDTHQEAWECEFHSIVVYDDYSTSLSASGAFQDRGQNNIVHKLTHISEGDNVSAGEVTVLFTTGARNTYIKEIVYRGRGTILSAFALGDPSTPFEHSFRVDKITAYQPKFAPRIARMNYPFTLNIGEVNILPYNAERQFYGDGGVPYFSLNNAGANLNVEKFNLYFNARNLASLDVASDYLCNMDGDFGKLRINVHTYTNGNTYSRMEKNFSGVRASVPSVIEDAVINWTAHIDDWVDTMTRDATFYANGEVSGDMKFSYKVLGDGIHRPDSSLSSVQTIFEGGMTLRAYDKSSFGMNTTLGITLDESTYVPIVGTSSTSTIGAITAPSYESQKLTITNLPWNESGFMLPVKLLDTIASANNTEDRVLAVGESITLTAFLAGSALIWHVPVS